MAALPRATVGTNSWDIGATYAAALCTVCTTDAHSEAVYAVPVSTAARVALESFHVTSGRLVVVALRTELLRNAVHLKFKRAKSQ